jgi:hypothetical protein
MTFIFRNHNFCKNDDFILERLDVKLHKNILCFSPSEIELLL